MGGFLNRLFHRENRDTPPVNDAGSSTADTPAGNAPTGSTSTGPSIETLTDLVETEIRDVSLYEHALRHRSLLRGMTHAYVDSNERLEYLGDAILGFVVADVLYRSFPEKTEGFLTRLRSKLVNGGQLAKSARRIDLGRHIQVGDSLASDEHIDNESILADAFEAIVGAIYLDLGMDEVRAFIDRTLLAHLDLDEVAERRDNFKSALLEYLQARGLDQPRYRVISETGPSHQKQFEVGVYLRGEEYGRGDARSKKRAEQAAARIALDRLRTGEAAADPPHSGFKQN